MENETIEYYFGDFVTALGRPHLVLVGYEDAENLHCEKYILFEKLDGRHTHIGEKVNSPKIEGVIDNLPDFIENQGLEHAKSIIYLEAYKEADKKKTPDLSYGLRDITLRKANQTSFLMYMKSKSESQLNWISNNTNSDKLKELIKLYKSINITHNKFDNHE
jgi:hypothetical protein